jgi:hypothetical protein
MQIRQLDHPAKRVALENISLPLVLLKLISASIAEIVIRPAPRVSTKPCVQKEELSHQAHRVPNAQQATILSLDKSCAGAATLCHQDRQRINVTRQVLVRPRVTFVTVVAMLSACRQLSARAALLDTSWQVDRPEVR